jgi:hypothetical protein
MPCDVDMVQTVGTQGTRVGATLAQEEQSKLDLGVSAEDKSRIEALVRNIGQNNEQPGKCVFVQSKGLGQETLCLDEHKIHLAQDLVLHFCVALFELVQGCQFGIGLLKMTLQS